MSWHGLKLEDDPVAELFLEARSADGHASAFSIVVHRPRAVPDENGETFVCRVQVGGAFHKPWNGLADIAGEGSWNAMQLAIQFARRVVEAECKRGVSYRWDGELVDIDLFFPR